LILKDLDAMLFDKFMIIRRWTEMLFSYEEMELSGLRYGIHFWILES